MSKADGLCNGKHEEALRAKMLSRYPACVAAFRRAGVSADLIEKIEKCYAYLNGGGMGKTMTVTSRLIYYLQLAEKQRSAVAALGYLVEDEP